MRKKYTRLPYILCYLAAFVIGIKQLREPDMWWQLLTGRWMLDNGQVTHTDVFSYTMEGTEWINVKWLYEVIIALIERGMGPHGVMLLQAVVNVGIVLLLLRVLFLFAKHLGSQVSTFYTTLTIVLFLLVSEFRLAGRPEMVSHLLTVTYMFILWRSPGFSWKRILWLVPLQCLWANMHEGYPVGMALIAIYIGGGVLSYLVTRSKEALAATGRLAAVWGGMALVILLNPNGLQLWKQPFEIFRQLKANKFTQELYSISAPEYWTFQAKVHMAMFAAACLFWIVRLIMNRRADKQLTFSPAMLGYLISIPVFGYLSMSALRNIPFSQIVLFPTIPVMLVWIVEQARLTGKSFYQKLARRTVIFSSVLAAALYILIVSNSYYKFNSSPERYGLHINTLHNPTSAAAFIQEQNLQGPAFSDYFSSSYLLWKLYPDFKSYIDLRDLDIFPQEFFDEYFDLYYDAHKFHDLDSNYKFNYIVLSTSQLTAVQQDLYWGEGFNVIHVDPVCIIMLRNNDENRAINQSPAASQLFTWPQDPLDPAWAEAISRLFNPDVDYEEEDLKHMPIHAGRFYNMVRNSRIAIRFLRPAALTDFSNDADVLALTGNAYLGYVNFAQKESEKHERIDSARIFYEQSLEVDKYNTEGNLGMAGIVYGQRRFKDALKYIERYLDVRENNDYVYFMKGLCIWNMNGQEGNVPDYEAVIEAMQQSARLNENNDKAYLYIADAYSKMGEKEKAREYFEKTNKEGIPWMQYEKDLRAQVKKELGYKDNNITDSLKKTLGTP